MTRLIDADKLLIDIEELKKSPWYNATYLSNERKIGMLEAMDMIEAACIRHGETVEAIPIEWIEEYCEEAARDPYPVYDMIADWKKEE